MFFQVNAQAFRNQRIGNPFNFAVAELRFRLPFELRIGDFHADNGG